MLGLTVLVLLVVSAIATGFSSRGRFPHRVVAEPGEFDLPIAIQSCDLVSDPSGCGTDFCQVAMNFPPNPCPLSVTTNPADPNYGFGAQFPPYDADVTCLEFAATPEQNACWTVFDGRDPSVENPELLDVADDGNAECVEVGDRVYLDDRDRGAIQLYIRDMMHGHSGPYFGDPRGVDRYPPFFVPSKPDSWVVKLPVVECRDEALCAGRSPSEIIGSVCFEIREITGPASRVIKGRFLCPDDPDPQVQALYDQYCAEASGDCRPRSGCNFGARGKWVVFTGEHPGRR